MEQWFYCLELLLQLLMQFVIDEKEKGKNNAAKNNNSDNLSVLYNTRLFTEPFFVKGVKYLIDNEKLGRMHKFLWFRKRRDFLTNWENVVLMCDDDNNNSDNHNDDDDETKYSSAKKCIQDVKEYYREKIESSRNNNKSSSSKVIANNNDDDDSNDDD